MSIRAHRDSKNNVPGRKPVHPLCPSGNENFVVNGQPVLDWAMERHGGKADKDSGLVKDANRDAIETMGDPRYPFDLFGGAITVSLETMKIVLSLPVQEID